MRRRVAAAGDARAARGAAGQRRGEERGVFARGDGRQVLEAHRHRVQVARERLALLVRVEAQAAGQVGRGAQRLGRGEVELQHVLRRAQVAWREAREPAKAGFQGGQRFRGERLAARVGVSRVGAARVGAARVGADRIGAEQVWAEQVWAEQVWAEQVWAEQVGAEQVGAERVGAEAGADASEAGRRARAAQRRQLQRPHRARPGEPVHPRAAQRVLEQRQQRHRRELGRHALGEQAEERARRHAVERAARAVVGDEAVARELRRDAARELAVGRDQRDLGAGPPPSVRDVAAGVHRGRGCLQAAAHGERDARGLRLRVGRVHHEQPVERRAPAAGLLPRPGRERLVRQQRGAEQLRARRGIQALRAGPGADVAPRRAELAEQAAVAGEGVRAGRGHHLIRDGGRGGILVRQDDGAVGQAARDQA